MPDRLPPPSEIAVLVNAIGLCLRPVAAVIRELRRRTDVGTRERELVELLEEAQQTIFEKQAALEACVGKSAKDEL